MKLASVFLILLVPIFLLGQKVDNLDQYKLDTLKSDFLSARQVIVFKNEGLFFYLDYKNFKDSVTSFRKAYKRTDKKATKQARLLIRIANERIRNSDTVFMDNEHYNLVGFYFVERFITTQIDQGKCLLKNSARKTIPIIIRIRGSYIRGTLNGWGGSRYYIPGNENHFAEMTKWIA